jgi:ribonuclease HI
MQQKLDRFFKFNTDSSVLEKEINPFGDVSSGSGSGSGSALSPRPKPQKDILNILDSPLENSSFPGPANPASSATSASPASSTTFASPNFFTLQKEISQMTMAPIAQIASTEYIEMIQPKTKEGNRLLYKHPKLPRVGVKGEYYLLVGESDRSEAAWLLQFDGAANPNPGPASSGAVLWSPKDLEGKRIPVFESGKYLGKATNNIAEVQGLLLGLQIAATRGAREILIEGDSELIVFQQIGRYRVSDKNLKVWWANIQAAMMDESAFDWIAIRQVPRELNERADSITKEVLSRKASFQRA